MNPSLPQRPNRPLPPRPQRPVFDVMRPGRAPASSTSKPIIASHKPMVRDTSITGTNPAAMRRPLMSTGQKIHIQPAGTPQAAPLPATPMRPAATAPVLQSAPIASVPIAPQQRPVLRTTPLPSPATTNVHAPTALPPAQQPVMRSSIPIAPTQAAAVPPPATNGPLTVPTPVPAPATGKPGADVSDDALFNNLASPAVNPETYPNAAVSRRVGHGEFPLKNTILSVIVGILIIMLIDILIDADFVSWGVPHTNFF